MYSKYLKNECSTEDSLRFKFRAVVSCSYIDKSNNYVSSKFILDEVDITSNGFIGVTREELTERLTVSFPLLNEEEREGIISDFVSSSFSVSEDYLSIAPDFIIQCTGKVCNGNILIYEGDILKSIITKKSYCVVQDNEKCCFILESMHNDNEILPLGNLKEYKLIGNVFQGLGSVL